MLRKTKYTVKLLDKLLREACFARDQHKCVKCGRTDTLAPSHIYPKGVHKRMRWDLDNVLTLCYFHHIHWWHKNPIEAHEWLESYMDKKKLDRLKLMARTVIKSPIDYEAIKLYLESEKKLSSGSSM